VLLRLVAACAVVSIANIIPAYAQAVPASAIDLNPILSLPGSRCVQTAPGVIQCWVPVTNPQE